jgi:hypothetical protein
MIPKFERLIVSYRKAFYKLYIGTSRGFSVDSTESRINISENLRAVCREFSDWMSRSQRLPGRRDEFSVDNSAVLWTTRCELSIQPRVDLVVSRYMDWRRDFALTLR